MALSLSEEQKRRIEEEEAVRIAEEAYREEVRRSMRSSATAQPGPEPSPDTPPRFEHHARMGWGLPVSIILAVLVGIAWIVSTYAHPKTMTDDGAGVKTTPLFSPWVPAKVTLADGQFQVRARNYISWTILVPDATVRNYHVTGHYSTIGGSGNDIQAVIATEDEFQNWINGHQARVFYGTPARVTTGNIDVALPPGRYVLAFNNRFSLLTDKAVFAEINATYEQNR